MLIKRSFCSRARLRRNLFFSLDGEWDFEFSKEAFSPSVFDQTITVPFPPESEESGVACWHSKGTYLHYRKIFSLPSGFVSDDDEVLLHFGAISPQADVFLNGKLLGTHTGGYLPFSFSVGHLLKQENVLTVRVYDVASSPILYNRQSKRVGAGRYFSGIWQSVYLECVPQDGIYGISVISTDTEARITVRSSSKSLAIRYQDGDERVTLSFSKEIVIRPKNRRLWSPEEPNLYPFTVFSPSDEATSYFALRRLEVREVAGHKRFYLNGKPYFLHGVESTGRYPQGIALPKSIDGYAEDILKIKALGFNTVYKHLYPEAPDFYAACDNLGLIVFQDIACDKSYSFSKRAASPRAWFEVILNRNTRQKIREKDALSNYMRTTFDFLCFYPSVLLLTAVNEGWEKNDAEAFYQEYKSRYPDILLSVRGGFRVQKSDIQSDHVTYKCPKDSYTQERKAIILSSVGAYSHPISSARTMGKLKKRFTKRIFELYQAQIVPAIRAGASGALYTQFSDDALDDKGLLSADRAVLKVDEGQLKEIAQALKDTYCDVCNEEP